VQAATQVAAGQRRVNADLLSKRWDCGAIGWCLLGRFRGYIYWSMQQEHRTVRMSHNVIRDATQQGACRSSERLCAHDDHVRADRLGV
jgi:hypothetical protein